MNRYAYALVIVALVELGGCDLQQLATDAEAGVAALQQDKSVVENLVADIKRNYTPDTRDYQDAEKNYFLARRSYDQYLGRINLAASTADRSVIPDESGETARAAMTEFARGAAASLAPNDRALPALIAFAAFPAFHKLLSLSKGKQVVAVRSVVNKVQWRSWDSITPERTESTAKRIKRKLKRYDASDE